MLLRSSAPTQSWPSRSWPAVMPSRSSRVLASTDNSAAVAVVRRQTPDSRFLAHSGHTCETESSGPYDVSQATVVTHCGSASETV